MTSTGPKYHWPGVNQSSPDHPMAVRISNGEEFFEDDNFQGNVLRILSCLLGEAEIANEHRKLTNTYLSHIYGEDLGEDDDSI